jgi:hypothetical protein
MSIHKGLGYIIREVQIKSLKQGERMEKVNCTENQPKYMALPFNIFMIIQKL